MTTASALVIDIAPERLANLIVCTQCDALYQVRQPARGEVAVCARCHTVLVAPRAKAALQIVALAVATLILIFGATVFPFLRIEAGGVANAASVLDVAFAFSQGILTLLVVATIALILAIPALRAGLIVYVLTPFLLDRPALPGARAAFRMAQSLRPWAMAEIFAIGCAVSLVKVADLAHVSFGPAFWMFAVLTVFIVIQTKFMCSWSVWNALASQTQS